MKFNLFHSKDIKITFLECMKFVLEYMQGSLDGDRRKGRFWVLYLGALLCTCCSITFAAVSKPDDRSYQTQKVARHIKSKNHQNCLLYPKSVSCENFFVWTYPINDCIWTSDSAAPPKWAIVMLVTEFVSSDIDSGDVFQGRCIWVNWEVGTFYVGKSNIKFVSSDCSWWFKSVNSDWSWRLLSFKISILFFQTSFRSYQHVIS